MSVVYLEDSPMATTKCIQLQFASKELHGLIRSIVMNNTTSSHYYNVSKKAGAFFQGGSDLDEGWILIEFWIPKGAQEFVDLVNSECERLGITE